MKVINLLLIIKHYTVFTQPFELLPYNSGFGASTFFNKQWKLKSIYTTATTDR